MKDKPTLYVLVGIPGSGKSTWAEKHSSLGTIVSRDKIRYGLVKEDEPYFSKESEVFNIFMDTINQTLSIKQNTIADATHLNEKNRNKLINHLCLDREEYFLTYVYFNTPFSTCFSRNSKREGRANVSEEAMLSMESSLKAPAFEGAGIPDEIWYITQK